MPDSPLEVRLAQASELPRINTAYTGLGYTGKVTPADTVFVAEREHEIVGLVRRTHEHGVTMLRGMYVVAQAQRQGIGSDLLAHFVTHLNGQDCYCVPYTHLVGFYSSEGFQVLPPGQAPGFLAERLVQYRHDGGDVLLMWRPGAPRLL